MCLFFFSRTSVTSHFCFYLVKTEYKMTLFKKNVFNMNATIWKLNQKNILHFPTKSVLFLVANSSRDITDFSKNALMDTDYLHNF